MNKFLVGSKGEVVGYVGGEEKSGKVEYGYYYTGDRLVDAKEGRITGEKRYQKLYEKLYLPPVARKIGKGIYVIEIDIE